MIKAILIDGYGQRISQMHIKPSFHDVEEIIGSNWWGAKPVLLDNGDLVYRSEEAKHGDASTFSFQGILYRGNALIARLDCYSDLMDCRTEFSSVRPCVEWK